MEEKYDVIIVGSGVAGCFSALQFPEDYNILMITKQTMDKSNSYLAQGGICVLKSPNDRDAFIEDTLKAGHYENNVEAVKMMVDSSKSVIEELETIDVEFDKDNQEYSYKKEGENSSARILYHEDITGKEITSKLIKKVQEKNNITILENMEMIDVLENENQCYGIVIRNKNKKNMYIYASYVILATGGVGGLYPHSTNYAHIQGDAMQIAMKHNIKCKDIDYVQFHPTTLYSPKSGQRFLISESVRGEGALLYNKNKERFTNELLPRDILTKEIYKQMKADNQPYVWLSMMDIKEVDIEKRFPTIIAHCRKIGYDPKKEWIPVVPSQHYFMGGIAIDLQGKTSMKCLYAAGETACNGVHGKNRLASNSLLESLVFAKRAAKDIIDQKRETYDWKKAEISKKDI
ncbi:MAG: L-aspartate oxidase [Coprobacillaceae bacterium]